MFNIAPHGKELSEDLRIRIVALYKDGLGYKKFGNNLELIYSTVDRVKQRFSKADFTRDRPCKGRSKKLSPCAVRQVQKLASKNKTHECCQHCFRSCRSGRSACQCSDHTPHTATSGGFYWSWLTKKPANSLLKTIWPRTLITGTMSCGLMNLRVYSH